MGVDEGLTFLKGYASDARDDLQRLAQQTLGSSSEHRNRSGSVQASL